MDAVLPRSMNFSMPEFTKMIAIRMRPIASIASLTPAAARTSIRVESPAAVVALMGSLPDDPTGKRAVRKRVPRRTGRVELQASVRSPMRWNLYTATGGITLWDVIRSCGPFGSRAWCFVPNIFRSFVLRGEFHAQCRTQACFRARRLQSRHDDRQSVRLPHDRAR